ncbi:hypothetical protein LINPERPRIM_LOCUS31604 [Linum perenne]
MEGKKKKCGGLLFAKPYYKNAYITFRTPLSLSPDLFPFKHDRGKKHWIDGKRKEKNRNESCGNGYKGRSDAAAVERIARAEELQEELQA